MAVKVICLLAAAALLMFSGRTAGVSMPTLLPPPVGPLPAVGAAPPAPPPAGAEPAVGALPPVVLPVPAVVLAPPPGNTELLPALLLLVPA